MSAIIKRFDIPMTRKQIDKVQSAWVSTIGHSGGMMLAVQPIGGSFRSRKYSGSPILRCAIVDWMLGQEIRSIIKRHKKARP